MTLFLKLIKALGDLKSTINMPAKIVWCCHLEHICVERGHFGLYVVEEVGLLHMGALNLDGDFFKELVNLEARVSNRHLRDSGDDLAFSNLEASSCLFRESIGMEWVQTIVGF